MQQLNDVSGPAGGFGGVMIMAVLFVLVALAGAAAQSFRLSLRGKRFATLADLALEGLLITEGGQVVDVNRAACRLFGRSPRAIIGQPIEALFAAEHRSDILRMQRTLDSSTDVELIAVGGVRRAVNLVGRTGGHRAVAGTVFALREVSDAGACERRLTASVHLNRMTGIANEALLRDRLGQALAISERSGANIAVLCVSIDRIGESGAGSGEHVHERLLEAAAKRLRGATRDIDTVASPDGDHFVVVQPFSKQPESVKALSRSLWSALNEPYVIDGHVIVAATSIGIALHPGDAGTADDLVDGATEALRRAQCDGGGKIRFLDVAIDEALHAEFELESRLRLALEQEEMALAFQPVFETERLQLVAYEALLRWNSPTHGTILPGVFLPVAEQCGLMPQLGNWVLETACAAAARLPPGVRIAVNIHSAQFQQHDLPTRIADTLMRTGLAPDRLEIEITEAVLLADSDLALATLHELRRQRVRVALDDFGTGHASLGFLRMFPFDRIKMDRSFVRELGSTPNATSLVHAMLLMARTLMIEVTAEGVESDTQLAVLRDLKCDYVQGYLLGCPAPLNEFLRPPARPPQLPPPPAAQPREAKTFFPGPLAKADAFGLSIGGVF